MHSAKRENPATRSKRLWYRNPITDWQSETEGVGKRLMDHPVVCTQRANWFVMISQCLYSVSDSYYDAIQNVCVFSKQQGKPLVESNESVSQIRFQHRF